MRCDATPSMIVFLEEIGKDLHFQELWELNLTTRRWTKSQMKGDIPEQLVS